jgi:hypothetical protein
MVKSCLLLCFVVFASLTACAIPKIQELRSTPPNERFAVQAPLGCLYDKGVEHVSSYIGMTEPKFTWYFDPSRHYAWFRQPLTLVELEAKSSHVTEVRRAQTPSAQSFGQGDELVKFLKANPCIDQQ